MVVARNGSPILVGLHEDSIYIASERIAFEKYTSNFITLNDGEMILLDLENRQQLYKSVKERISFITEKMNVEVKPR
jgi:glucosamine--fructose-6-phosphate aminotransferase (isomerizing)